MNINLGDINFSSTAIGYSTDPILEYIFDTAAAAVNQAKLWGFDGYRAYLINGVVKYIPCTTSAEYQQATQLYIKQGAIVAQGKEVFGDKLVGYQFTEKDNIKGDPIYTLGNFTITTNINAKKNNIFTLADSKRGYSALDLDSNGIASLKSNLSSNVTAKVRFDKSNLEKYVTYSSLSERLRVALQEIAETFPASIHVIPYSINNPAVFDYFDQNGGSSATFKIRIQNIHNPYNIDFYKTGLTATVSEYLSSIRNFAKNYIKYDVYYNGVAYPIVGIIPPTTPNDANGLVLIVQGDPFSSVVSISKTANVGFYLKPNKQAFDDFYNSATDLAAYLLNPKSVPLYAASFNVPSRSDDGVLHISPRVMQFPLYDEFNVDIFNTNFDNYTTNLQAIADEFDRYKTDLISRFLTSDSLQEFDTPDRKAYAISQTYGYMFDNIKKYADGIAYMTRVSYDKIDNVPDVLLKNFAHMLGWKTYEIEQDDTLIESLFDISADRQGDDTPAEIDIELWRRIIINSFYLFKSKGTRKSIEFALELVGIPLEIMDINEYVYVADHVLPYGDYYNIFHEALVDYPIDTDGYPTTPPNLYFQAYGGNMLNDAQNSGPYDNGQAYFNEYRKFNAIKAFDLHRTIDNKKSWVTTNTETEQNYEFLLRDTNYTIKDSRLVINSKEAEASISSQMTFDYYVYQFYVKNGYTISVSNATVNPSTLTFNDYIREITSKLIDPRNRKVIKTYPVLSKIYWDYLDYTKTLNVKAIDYTKTLNFMKTFDTYWVKLLQQFIPATSIFLAGRKYADANVTRSKFAYKHGLNNNKSWMGTDGSEFQDDALKPSPVGNLDIFKCDGYLGLDLHGNNIIIKTEAKLSDRAESYLARGGYYNADNYGFYRHNEAQQNILQAVHANYGIMTGLTSSLTTGKISFLTNASIAGTTDITGASMENSSGSTFDTNLGDGFYAGLVSTGTTGSIKIELDPLPIDGSAIYPLIHLPILMLKTITVEPDVYYELNGDIMFDTSVSGNTAYSFVGLMPLAGKSVVAGTAANPTLYITNRDLMEGAFGAHEYDKYNWIHMKTKFKSSMSVIHMAVVAKDIYYDGSCLLHLKDFSINKVPVDINFITPPPLPHVCYFDYDGFSTDLLTKYMQYPDFVDSGYWDTSRSISSNVTQTMSLTGDAYTMVFDYTTADGIGAALASYTDLVTPVDNAVYYYRIVVDASYAGTELTYTEQPTIYIDPFLEANGVLLDYPIKLKANINQGPIVYEGFYHLTTAPAVCYTKILVNNITALDADYTMVLSEFTLQQVNPYYISEHNELFWYKQPHAFGYSKNIDEVAPDYALGGNIGNWVIPYLPIGHTGATGDTAGVYEEYFDPIAEITTGTTTPLMHVNSTYVDKFDLTTADTVIDINLTHTCGLGYQFYIEGATPPTLCITPRGVTIDNQLFMSGSLDLTFDGFYPLTGSTEAGLGPFYEPESVYGIYANVGTEDVNCLRRANTRLSIINNYSDNWSLYRNDTGYTITRPDVPDDFATDLTTVSLANRNGNRYVIANRYNLIKIEASLIYDSTTDNSQIVIVKLMGASGNVYNQKSYTVGGSNNSSYATVQSRTLDYSFDGFYYVNDEIYLTVYPQSYDCVFKTEEAIDNIGGYVLSGSTANNRTLFKATSLWDAMANSGDGDWIDTYFTGDTYQYMIDSKYDVLRFTPTFAISGPTAPIDIYGSQREYYMAYVSGNTAPNALMTLMSDAVDRSQYNSDNAFVYGITQLPAPFTGITWTDYDINGVPSEQSIDSLSGDTYSIIRKSYVKIYESEVTGINSNLENYLLAFYKSRSTLKFKHGYSKYFFDDPINRFYTASDATSREVFTYGLAEIVVQEDGIHLVYNFAKDLAGYPITGEFIGRLTAKDPCGNFATIYVLLGMNVKNTAAINRIGNIYVQASAPIEITPAS